MHSYQGKTATYHYNAGLEGDLVIVDTKNGNDIRVDAKEVVELVINEVINSKIIGFVESGGISKFLNRLE